MTVVYLNRGVVAYITVIVVYYPKLNSIGLWLLEVRYFLWIVLPNELVPISHLFSNHLDLPGVVTICWSGMQDGLIGLLPPAEQTVKASRIEANEEKNENMLNSAQLDFVTDGVLVGGVNWETKVALIKGFFFRCHCFIWSEVNNFKRGSPLKVNQILRHILYSW